MESAFTSYNFFIYVYTYIYIFIESLMHYTHLIQEINVASKETALKEEIESLKLSLRRTGQELSRLEEENESLQIEVQTSQAQVL